MSTIAEILDDPEKLAEVTKLVFDAVDTDASGKIDKFELKKAMHIVAYEAGIDPPTDQNVNDDLVALYTNQDGTIDLKEFEGLIRQLLEALQ